MKNLPLGNQGLAFQAHALQVILFGPFYVRTHDSSRIVSSQVQLGKVLSKGYEDRTWCLYTNSEG